MESFILGHHRKPGVSWSVEAMDDRIGQRISIDPRVMAGKPVVRGTRIPVELIVRMLAQGIPESEILREYPRLQLEDIRAALAYAAEVLALEDVFPVTAAA
jgi:uncharacterized protein (DUF433 family)